MGKLLSLIRLYWIAKKPEEGAGHEEGVSGPADAASVQSGGTTGAERLACLVVLTSGVVKVGSILLPL